jgi:hypothetical protein
VAINQHFFQRKIAETPDRRVANVGRERATRIDVLEQIGDGIADEHFVPDPDPHWRAFFGIYRLASQIFLIQPHVDNIAVADPTDKDPFPSEFQPKKMESWFLDHSDYLAKHNINMTLPFMNNRIDPKKASKPQNQRDAKQQGEKG